MYALDDLKRLTIPLGKRGENGATVLQFDLTDWLADHSGGVAAIHAIRPTESDAEAYVALGTTMNADTTTFEWTVDATDTGIVGKGGAEVYLTDDPLIQIYLFHTYIENAIGDTDGVLTDPRALTTAGDLMTFTTVPARLPIGASGYVLGSNGTAPVWEVNLAIGTLINVKNPPYGLVAATGNGTTDDTAAINAAVQYAIANKLAGVYIPDSTSSYMINASDDADTVYHKENGGIVIDAPFRFVMHPKAALKAITSSDNGYTILNIKDASDVYVQGGNILGERSTHIGVIGEHGMGIAVVNSKRVHIEDLNISDCWGDGVYIGGRDNSYTDFSEDVFVSRVISKNNRRLGLSIVSAVNVYINNCECSDTNGISPQSGIDAEANPGYPDNENIFITNCYFENNAVWGIVVTQIATNVQIIGNTFVGGSGGIVNPPDMGTDGLIISGNIIRDANMGMDISNNNAVITNNIISGASGTDMAGIFIEKITAGHVIISGNIIDSCYHGIMVEPTACMNVEILNNTISNITKNGIYTHYALTNSIIKGNRIITCGLNGINVFSACNNLIIADNEIRDVQYTGIDGYLSNSIISGNHIINAGLIDVAYYGINLMSATGGGNFITNNRIRSTVVGHVAIVDSATPTIPNIISNNDVRYGAAAAVLDLDGTDVVSGNFTIEA